MTTDDSIILNNVSKSFRIFHEKRNSVYEYLTSFLDRKKSYDNLEVLKNMSFSVKKGEMIGIIGFNGSGKTTLLKIMGKIYLPDSGTIVTNGRLTPFLELGTGFNGELTARDNIIIYGVILGLTKKEIKKRIDSIAKFAEIERFLDTKLKNFSSGMNARLAFSTAVQVEPDIMLVDEILSVGDISFQKKSFNTFMDFKKKGKTIVFVSHAIDQMEQLCDKVLWIHDGMIQKYGESLSVISEYRKFAAEKKP
ncbi:MAG TPA: ABC transporter ATP-binding protein [Candidatus Nitrosotalea sp.]|nr:ABC transporter ATP-binding protein [Candidatus Nitrosotalea sp.]